MKYDDLVEAIGELGPYQRRIYALACLPMIVASVQTFLPVFILAVPEFRCSVPGLSNDTYNAQGDWHWKLINYTLPWSTSPDDNGGDSMWGSAQCSVFEDRDISSSSGLPTNETTACKQWVYDTSVYDNSFVTKIDLVCDRKVLRSHANMIYMCGLLAGSFVFGFVSDSFGRKTAFLVGLAVQVCAGVTVAFADNFILFAIMRFFIAVGNSGIFMCCFVLAMELMGKSFRAQAGICVNFSWALGMFILNALAYFVRDWQHLQLICSCSSVSYVILLWILPESARWQMTKGHVDKARATLEKAARANGRELPPGAFESLEEKKEEEKEKEKEKEKGTGTEEASNGKLTDIFVSPLLSIRMFVIFVNWVVVTMVYYGLTLNVGSMGGSVYVNFALSAVMETLATLATLWALPRYGRKRFHCFSLILGGSACLASMIPAMVGESSPQWVMLVLSNIGKFGATGAFSTIYVFTAELFPTALRNTVIGTSSMMARLGGIAAPYIADLGVLVGGRFGTALPYVVFGASSLVGAFLALTLPETLGVPTPETIEDAVRLGKEKPDSTPSVYNLTETITMKGIQSADDKSTKIKEEA